MFIKIMFLLPMVALSSTLVMPINKVAPALKQSDVLEKSSVLEQTTVDEVCESDGAVVEGETCDSDGPVDNLLVNLELELDLNGLLSNIICILGGVLGHPIDPAMMLARKDGNDGKLVDLELGVDLNGLLSDILCLLSSLLGSILKKGEPIDPAMMLARKDVSGGDLVDLGLNVDSSSLSCLLGNILCLLSGLLGNILKTHPIDQDVLLRGGLSSNSLRSDNVPLVDLSVLAILEGLLYSTIDAEVAGENGLLDANVVAILDHLLALVVSINVKGHPVNLAAAELGRKLFDGIAEKNVAKVMPINKVAPALKQSDVLEKSSVLEQTTVDEVCESDGAVVEGETCDSDGPVDNLLVNLELELDLNGLLSNIICILGGVLGTILKKGHPIDPAMMLARNDRTDGKLVDLNLGVDLNGLLSDILCLLSSLLGSILKKGQPIDPTMMLARKDVSGGELVDLGLNVDSSSLSCLLGNILCLLSGLLGNILKTHPIDQDVLMRGGLSSNSLKSDNVPLVDLSVLAVLEGLLYSTIDAEVAGENGLLDANVVAILDHLLALVVSINVKGHPVNLAAAELERKLFDGIAEKNVANVQLTKS
ncbi:unnamed protein product [Ceutorhynchus assimilis]|uniref:Uncharacterized protein n=1 Tax=Ceutorhynchus assimilis TaxID=467358 RepID=A0A9N9MQX2_9CUCU|nr:unnamed protein product [Ceutorhynchus assimilis]